MEKITCKNPYTQDVIGEFNCDSFELADGKVNELRKAQGPWAALPLKERLHAVQEGLKYFDSRREEIARDICEQMGRPLHQARGELNGFFERANYLCSIAESVLVPDRFTDKPGFDRAIEHVPMGVIFVISAWNYPLLITVNSVVPALISGNTVLLKHSSLTPKIGQHFERAFGKLKGMNVLSQTIVDHRTTGLVIEKSAIDHVVFTGSVEGGRSILQHTAKRFMRPALELGGKDGAYVHKDADIKQAADTIVDGAMFNSGQSCCGIERAYVHKDVFDEFMQQAKKLVDSYKLGDPKDETTSLGPLAQAKAAKAMEDQVVQAVKAGAKLLCGGKTKVIHKGTFFEATLLAVNDNKSALMQEENFGPILPVMKVDSLEQGIEMVNDSHYGLTAAIFTRDTKVAERFAHAVNVGTVFMNRCDYLDPALPWTGVKDSGCGSSLSKYGFYNVTRPKGLHFKVKI